VQPAKVPEKSGFAMNGNCTTWISKIVLTAGEKGVTSWLKQLSISEKQLSG